MESAVRHPIEDLSQGQPFCAGACVFDAGALLFTVGKERYWTHAEAGETVIPVRWVGGGQEPGETIVECAKREAEEELGCNIELKTSPVTHWYDLCGPADYRQRRNTSLGLSPVLVERRPGLSEPYKPGLPVGPFVYVAIYRARGCAERGDVPALVRICQPDSIHFRRGITVRRARERGLLFAEHAPLPANAVLRYESTGPELGLATLLERGRLPS